MTGHEGFMSNGAMLTLQACPRCNGAVLRSPPSEFEGTLCVNCGWRQPDISAEVQAQIEARLGKPSVEEPYTRRRIGRGKPPLSGWERAKRQKERDRRAQ